MQRVVAYCRVSTDTDDQRHSLASQKNFFHAYINKNPDWIFAGLYADEGISGTSTKKRKDFNRMITDGESGRFDMILTKEISRFARNTLDSIFFTRKLKSLGIGVIFLNDNINTLDPESELRLTIMSSIAQEESRKTSERVKWGQRRSMEQGVAFGRNGMLGYHFQQGKLTVDPSTAKHVQLIFDKYLHEAKGLSTIARELEQAGILTGCGNTRWDATAVLRILQNEKYVGDLKQRKFYKPSYLDVKSLRNKGEKAFICHRNHHEPIISREIFDQTQTEIVRRRNLHVQSTRYTNRYAFSGKLQCGLCGARFVSRNRNSKTAEGVHVIRRWQCARYFKYGAKHNDDRGCTNTMIRQELLEAAFQQALRDTIECDGVNEINEVSEVNEVNSVSAPRERLIDECITILSRILDTERLKCEHTETIRESERLKSRITQLIRLHLDGTIQKDELLSLRRPIDRQIVALEDKLKRLDTHKTSFQVRDALIAAAKERITHIVYAEVFSEDVAAEVLKKIIIHGTREHGGHDIDVYLKDEDGDSDTF